MFCTECGTSINANDKFCNGCGSRVGVILQASSPDESYVKPPTVLGDFLQPGLPAKIFTVFFFPDRLVAARTGSGSANSAGVLSTFLAGDIPMRIVGDAFGTIADQFSREDRNRKAAQLAGYDIDTMVATDKANFQLPYSAISGIEIKGPNFAGEVNVKISAGKDHKFRVDDHTKDSVRYIVNIFNEFVPGKVVKK